MTIDTDIEIDNINDKGLCVTTGLSVRKKGAGGLL